MFRSWLRDTDKWLILVTQFWLGSLNPQNHMWHVPVEFLWWWGWRSERPLHISKTINHDAIRLNLLTLIWTLKLLLREPCTKTFLQLNILPGLSVFFSITWNLTSWFTQWIRYQDQNCTLVTWIQELSAGRCWLFSPHLVGWDRRDEGDQILACTCNLTLTGCNDWRQYSFFDYIWQDKGLHSSNISLTSLSLFISIYDYRVKGRPTKNNQ